MLGRCHILTDILVAFVFIVERVWRILQMSGNEELTTATGHHDADTAVLRLSNQRQFRIGEDILPPDFRMTAVGHHELIVESTEDGQLRIQGLLREDAKHLHRQRVLGYTVMEIESSLGSPTDI